MSLANNKDEVEVETIDDSLHNKRFQRSLLSSDQSKDDVCVKTIKKMQDLLNQFTKGHVLDTMLGQIHGARFPLQTKYSDRDPLGIASSLYINRRR